MAEEGKFECPNCRTRIAVSKDLGGAEVECPGCEQAITIPRTFLVTGDKLGGFRIQRLLGSGGMGDVFLAIQVTMQRKVALKILPETLTADRESLEEFLHEVRMTARLEHPNIVTAFEAGEADGRYYLATSFVDGQDLEQIVREHGPFAEARAVEITSTIATALRYAWTKEHILHRDVKPANVMLDADGEVKVLDLGIARSQFEGDADGGLVMGTPDYMSPEQASGASEIDCRSDMYSLGALLYHLVTGSPPFPGGDAMSTMQAHVSDTPMPPEERNAELSQRCSQLITRTMAKVPANRYRDWDELLEALEAYNKPEDEEPAKADAPPRPREKRARGRRPASEKAKVGGEKAKAGGAAKPAGARPAGAKPAGAGKTSSRSSSHTRRPRSKGRRSNGASRPPAAVSPSQIAAARQRSPVPVALIVFIVVTIAGVLYMVSRQSPPASVPPKRPPQQQTTSIEDREYQQLQQYAEANPDQIDEQLRRWAVFLRSHPASRRRNEVQSSINQLKQRRALRDISAQAAKHADAQRFREAAEILTGYSGPYAAEIQPQCQALARKYAQQAQQMDKLHEEARQQALDAIATRLLRQDFSGVATQIARFRKTASYRTGGPELREAVALAENALKLPAHVLRGFTPQIGRDIEIALKSGRQRIKLVRVGDDRIDARRILEHVQAPVSYRYAEFAASEKLKRLGSGATPGFLIMRGIVAREFGRDDKAREFFREARNELGKALLRALDNPQAQLPSPEEEAVAARDQLLQELDLDWEDLRFAEPASLKRELSGRERQLKQRLESYRKRFGKTRTGAAFLRAIAPVLAAASPAAAAGDASGMLALVVAELQRRNPRAVAAGMVADQRANADGQPEMLRLNIAQLSNCEALAQLKSLRELYLVGPADGRAPLSDIAALTGLPLQRLEISHAAVSSVAALKGMQLETLSLTGTSVRSLAALRGQTQLKTLNVSHTPLRSLEGLEGARLELLDISHCKSLTELPAEISIKVLKAAGAGLKSLAGLRNSPVVEIDISGCPVYHLTGLRDTPVEKLTARNTPIRRIEPLADTSIAWLDLSGSNVKDLSPLAETPISHLNIDDTPVDSVRGLAPTQLVTLQFNGYDPKKHRDALLEIVTLQKVNGRAIRARRD
jgi:serine/threonine protein kinase